MQMGITAEKLRNHCTIVSPYMCSFMVDTQS